MTKQLKALADPTRYRILQLLTERHYCVQVIAETIGISESAVSQHMKLLKDAGLVEKKRLGYHMHYYVKAEVLQETARLLQELAAAAEAASVRGIQCACQYHCGRTDK